eukprot:6214353-Pleurochrysis_carterae.AAC.1
MRNLEKQVASMRKRSVHHIGAFLLGQWPQPRIAAKNTESTSTKGTTSAVLRVCPAGAGKAERALERALIREQRAHAFTKLQLGAATDAAAAHEKHVTALVKQNSRIPHLEKLVVRLESQLKAAPSEELHQTLRADLLRAERTVRGLIRQSEDAGAKADRVAASLRRERQKAIDEVAKKEKECVAARKREEAAAQLARDAAQKAQMMRSGVAAVAAEKRAHIAEEAVAQLEAAAVQMDVELQAVKAGAAAEQTRLQGACNAAALEAKAAHSVADELKQQAASGAAEIALLQQNLAAKFEEISYVKESLAAEKELAIANAKAACAVNTKKIALDTKAQMVRNALTDPLNLSPHSRDIRNASLKAVDDFLTCEPIGLDNNGNFHHRGRPIKFRRTLNSSKPLPELCPKQLRVHTNHLDRSLDDLATGREHAKLLLEDHAKANPDLYKKLGLKLQRKLSVEQTAAFCNETSGLLGAAIRCHLKDCGMGMASKADLRSYFQESWEECETGKITVPDPKRHGRVKTGGWLRVTDLAAVIQRSMTRFAQKGQLAWPSNISGNECWFQLIIDKGSSATKIVVKYNCIARSESVRNVSLVGMLDRVKDTYDMMSIFKPLFDQFNDINRRGLCVWTPWQQLLPSGFKASAADQHPIPDVVEGTSLPTDADGASASSMPAAAAARASVTPPDQNTAPLVPDCKACARFGPKCPSKLRRAFASNGPGNVEMDMDFGDGPGLLSNTHCTDCNECTLVEGGQLSALRRQWAEVDEHGPAWRRMRGMIGGDWLSIAVPLGLGGPKNKQFCMVCLASLHNTNVAGVPQLPTMPLCYECADPREPHIAQPQLRAGTASIELQADAYARALTAHATGDLSRKPEPANFDSCVEPPLVWAGEHILDLISCTPLHFMLGITVDLVNCLEWELKVLDWECARQPADPKLAQELQQIANEAADMRAEVGRWEEAVAHHKNSLEIIEATPGAADAIELGKRAPKRGRSYTPIPLE